MQVLSTARECAGLFQLHAQAGSQLITRHLELLLAGQVLDRDHAARQFILARY